jgi:hypothetical protein
MRCCLSLFHLRCTSLLPGTRAAGLARSIDTCLANSIIKKITLSEKWEKDQYPLTVRGIVVIFRNILRFLTRVR